MDQLLKFVKPQLDAMNQMYEAGFKAGQIAAHREFAKDLANLQTNFKHTSAPPLQNRQGETHHEPQSHQA